MKKHTLDLYYYHPNLQKGKRIERFHVRLIKKVLIFQEIEENEMVGKYKKRNSAFNAGKIKCLIM
ncbi:hypothetical protein D0440_18275 [Priestia megaterium]|nr:hypothetical protein D0440_18275 [Priestia megaterium]